MKKRLSPAANRTKSLSYPENNPGINVQDIMDTTGYRQSRFCLAIKVFADPRRADSDLLSQFLLGQSLFKHPFPYHRSQVRIPNGEMLVGIVSNEIRQNLELDAGRKVTLRRGRGPRRARSRLHTGSGRPYGQMNRAARERLRNRCHRKEPRKSCGPR